MLARKGALGSRHAFQIWSALVAQVHYFETVSYQFFVKALQERRTELLEELAAGLEYEEYIKKIGHLNGLAEAGDIAKQVNEKIRSST
jgi:hypothetical protein